MPSVGFPGPPLSVRAAPLFALLLLATVSAQAQDGRRVLEAWQRDARTAFADVAAVTLNEQVVQIIEGPREPLRLETRGLLRLAPDARPDREVAEAQMGGRPVDPARVSFLARRLGRAFGPAGAEAARPAPLPGLLLRSVQPTDVDADRIDGQPAWRVTFVRSDGRATEGRGQAWFSRDASAPRLLRLELGADRVDGSVRRTIEYERVAGLDLPRTMRTVVTVRQRRRIRTYLVTLTADVSYRNARITRR